MVLMMMLLIMFSLNPMFSVLFSMMMSLMIMFYMKSAYLSLSIYLIIVIFISGVLLLLFYLTIVSVSYYNWNNNYSLFVSTIIILPNVFLHKNFKYSLLSSSLEMMSNKMIFFILLSLMLFLLLLKILNFLYNNFTYLRMIN